MIILNIFISILLGILSLAVFLLIVYVLILVRPCRKLPPHDHLLCDYAHRGLHGNGVPENSLQAFELACQAGVGIELDIQLSRDGDVMVFHDAHLKRMTGCDQKLCELDATELQTLSLAGSDQTIPTFRQVLELVNGRVPLLVELKGETANKDLCPRAAALLKDYSGDYCLESFNPLLIGEMAKLLPHAFRGLLYTDRFKKKKSVLNALLSLMALNIAAKPHFIAYDQKCRHSFPVKLTTKFYKAPKFVWTTKTEETRNLAHQCNECPIFEKEF